MATINKNIAASSLPITFKRGNPVPLDNSSVWYDYESMAAYAQSGATAYVGQILAYVNETDSTTTIYAIKDTDGTLEAVGSRTQGDDKSIVLSDDGFSLKNWGVKYYKWVEATGTEGQEGYVAGHHELQTVDAEHPWINGLEPRVFLNSDGTAELAWYQPSTVTVQGLNSTVSTLQTEVTSLRADIADKVDEATVASMVAAAGHLKREIVEELPDAAEADKDTIYMVKSESASGKDKYEEFMLVGEALEQIGDTSVDLSGYVQKEEGKALISETEIERIAAMKTIKEVGGGLNLSEAGALTATVQGVLLAGEEATVNDSKQIVIPLAAASQAGVVKGTDGANGVAVAEDGTMTVNSIEVGKLVNGSEELILFGGTAGVNE